MKYKKVAFLGCCTALALVLSYMETLFPPLIASLPGIKMGLANIVILFVLYRFRVRDAAMVSFVRIALSSLLFGSSVMFLYSAAGAFLSLLGMAILCRLGFLSEVGTSVAGAVLHNIGQILVAMCLLGTAELGYYLIVLAVSGTISGILIGLCAGFAIKRVPIWK